MKNKLLIAGILMLLLTACQNPFFPGRKLNADNNVNSREEIDDGESYVIAIHIVDKDDGDLLAVDTDSGKAGALITLNYTVSDTALHNFLDFSGVSTSISSVTRASSGIRTYIINADDASSDHKIIIIAAFEHTDLTLDPIAFSDTTTHIVKIYGDVEFTNTITGDHRGSGLITYSSEDETVATIDNNGTVTIRKVGATVITAHKTSDMRYATALRSYALTVNPKPLTISGLAAADKVYDGTPTATITGTATINGLISGDSLTIKHGTAAFVNAAVGNNKTVTFSGFSLGGGGVDNYIMAQPANVTATIRLFHQVWINPGTFQMGSPATEAGRISSETQHQVTLTNGFYIGQYQVKQTQYTAVMRNNPSYCADNPDAGEIQGNRPVETVSWYDALVFCNRLSMLEGLSPAYRISGSTNPDSWGVVPTNQNAAWDAVAIVAGANGYRLPTEAQWEYACRAGTTTAFNNGNNDYTNAVQVGAVAWYWDNCNGKTHAVGLKAPNAWGLYDMHGNVYEWCWDWYGTYASGAQIDPEGAVSGSTRVGRGASCYNGYQYLRSAYRYYSDPYGRSANIGCRLVRP